MLQALLEMAFKKHFIVSENFAFPPKTVMFPFTNVLVDFVKPVCSIAAPLSLCELAFVEVSVVVEGPALPMRLRCMPASPILFYIVVFDGLIMIDTLAGG